MLKQKKARGGDSTGSDLETREGVVETTSAEGQNAAQKAADVLNEHTTPKQRKRRWVSLGCGGGYWQYYEE